MYVYSNNKYTIISLSTLLDVDILLVGPSNEDF